MIGMTGTRLGIQGRIFQIMSELGNSLKTLIGNYSTSTRPIDFYFATMVTPTQIQLDPSQGPIPEALCIIPEWLRTFKVNITGTFHGESHTGELQIDNSLKAGDKVIVLQKTGGQKYLVLGRL